METNNEKSSKKFNKHEHPVEEWKEKHGRVKHITVKDLQGNLHDYVVGRPTMPVMDMISKYLNENKTNKYRDSMKNNCILFGDKDLVGSDIDVQNAVFGAITDLFEKLETTEKEL